MQSSSLAADLGKGWWVLRELEGDLPELRQKLDTL